MVAVCDSRADRLELTARRYPSVRCCEDASGLIAADDIDAVVVATPMGTHFALAAAALSNGKHVCVEKPLAASAGEAIELVRLARENKRVLMPGHTFLYSPPVVAIHELIAAGELGELYFISTSRVNLGLHQPDASVAWDLGSSRLLDSPLLDGRDAGITSAPSAVASSFRRSPTSHSSTSSSRVERSLTSSCPGSRRASSVGPRSSDPRRWWSMTT